MAKSVNASPVNENLLGSLPRPQDEPAHKNLRALIRKAFGRAGLRPTEPWQKPAHPDDDQRVAAKLTDTLLST
jgi:hypothetical protein